ncbi:unnamed protein product [Linum tenue]|uniref:SKP1 component POZ domain-containing protein n=1 Tax=Linum tenue TaxID=586396 RepID=A0AAV0LBW4_9ROSI|nr:unnamed protein product [Linum tenue]
MSMTSKTFTLKSSDSESFEVVAMQSQTIKHMIEDHCADDGIPPHNSDGANDRSQGLGLRFRQARLIHTLPPHTGKVY